MTTTNRKLLIAANRPVDILRKFTFDTTGGKVGISTCNAFIKKIKGSTIVWNQFVQNGNFADGFNGWGASDNLYTLQDGGILISPTSAYTNIFQSVAENVGHKYYIGFSANSSNGADLAVRYYNAGEPVDYFTRFTLPSVLTKYAKIITAPEAGSGSNKNLYFIAYKNNDGSAFIRNIQCIDLTLMFGAGNEPATVAEFEAMFPLDYYDYNAGQLLSFTGEDIKTTGFNQWDEQWELGGFSTGSGEPVSSFTNRIRSINFIQIIQGVTYYFRGGLLVFQYDSQKNFIKYEAVTNSVYQLESNCAFIKFSTNPAISVVTTYNYDICINISHNGTKNGTYEEYEQHTNDISFYKSIKDGQGNTLFPYGLLSAGSVYDEVTATKAIKRIGAVDLGSLNWVYGHNSDSTIYFFYIDSMPTRFPSFKNVSQSLINPRYDKYLPDQYNGSFNAPNKTISQRAATFAVLYIRDDSYTDAAAFKAAMQGVMLYYELAEPIEVSLSDIDLTYYANKWGTEHLLSDNTSVPTTTFALFDVRYKVGTPRT